MKGRSIGENIRTIADILNYCNMNYKPAWISLINLEKAFDTVKWGFLYKSHQAFNFGETFISLVKSLYLDIESCVTNNAKSSFFKPEGKGYKARMLSQWIAIYNISGNISP